MQRKQAETSHGDKHIGEWISSTLIQFDSEGILGLNELRITHKEKLKGWELLIFSHWLRKECIIEYRIKRLSKDRVSISLIHAWIGQISPLRKYTLKFILKKIKHGQYKTHLYDVKMYDLKRMTGKCLCLRLLDHIESWLHLS